MRDESEAPEIDRKVTRGLTVVLALLFVSSIAMRVGYQITDSWWPVWVGVGVMPVIVVGGTLYLTRVTDQPFWEILFHPSRSKFSDR